MPPRGGGRRRKRNTRVDAAVDAMGAMGFKESFVKATITELLKLYTEDGWNLIEENSYEVLRETLLEKQELLDQQQEVLTIDEPTAGPSTVPRLTLRSDNHDIQEVPQPNEDPEETIPITVDDSLAGPSTVPSLPLCCDDSGVEEAGFYPSSHQSEVSTQVQEIGGDSSNNRSAAPLHSKRPYRPCYGWISGDDEEVSEDDILTLEPMPFEEVKKITTSVQKYLRSIRSTDQTGMSGSTLKCPGK